MRSGVEGFPPLHAGLRSCSRDFRRSQRAAVIHGDFEFLSGVGGGRCENDIVTTEFKTIWKLFWMHVVSTSGLHASTTTSLASGQMSARNQSAQTIPMNQLIICFRGLRPRSPIRGEREVEPRRSRTPSTPRRRRPRRTGRRPGPGRRNCRQKRERRRPK